MRYSVLALFLAACQGCQSPPTPAPVVPVPGPAPVAADASPPVPVPPAPSPLLDAGKLDGCARMCRHLRAIKCPEGSPTPAGTPCEAVCLKDRAEPAARLSNRYLDCVSTMKACTDEPLCPR